MTLREMKTLNPETVDRSTLVDIATVDIDASLSKAEWLKEYLHQIKNPYLLLSPQNGTFDKVKKAAFLNRHHFSLNFL